MSDGTTIAQDVFGPGCAQVPTDPDNPVLIDDPVGTATGNNPF